MKTISKMYFKYEDVFKSERENIALEINSYIRCYVKITRINIFDVVTRFVVDVINDKEESSELKIFENINEFNSFVKFERWLND